MNRLPLLAAVLFSAAVNAQNIKLGELNSYKVFPAFLEPYAASHDALARTRRYRRKYETRREAWLRQ